METELTTEEKRLEREIRRDLEGRSRFVDAGILLRVVTADPGGQSLLPGKPAMRVLREHRFGCVIDTHWTPPRRMGPSQDPVVWLASEDQEAVLLHTDREVLAQIIFGSEGAGKTRVLAMIHALWWLDLLGDGRTHIFGQTAPTKTRLKMVLDEMRQLYPKSWYRYRASERLLTFCDGTQVQFLSTKKVSEALGSPGQGHNFSRLGRDELQDQIDADEDLESRGRAAPDGGADYRQVATCTAKESSAFRSKVQQKLASGLWVKRTLLITRSPFVSPAFLEQKKLVMSEREFRRRYYAEDLPPERMLYFNWVRAENLRPIPRNAKPITSHIIRLKTGNPRHALLVGHDPGIAKAGSIFLQAFEVPGSSLPLWWARAEILHKHTTTEQNAHAVLDLARLRFHMNKRAGAELAHVRAHPYGQSEKKPDLSVYKIFDRVGLNIRAAQYTKKGTGTGLIQRAARFDMMNALLRNAAGQRRLFVEADKQGQPLCPKFVEALETLERDEEGNAPEEDKDEHDLTDLPDACGYALWPWEKETAATLRVRAMQEAA